MEMDTVELAGYVSISPDGNYLLVHQVVVKRLRTGQNPGQKSPGRENIQQR